MTVHNIITHLLSVYKKFLATWPRDRLVPKPISSSNWLFCDGLIDRARKVSNARVSRVTMPHAPDII